MSTTCDLPLGETIAPADQAAVAEAVRKPAAKGRPSIRSAAARGSITARAAAAGHRPFAGQAEPRGRLSGRRPDDHRRGRHDDRRLDQALGRPAAAVADRHSAARPGDRRRRGGRQCGRPAPIRLRHDARLCAGLHGGRWRRQARFPAAAAWSRMPRATTCAA